MFFEALAVCTALAALGSFFLSVVGLLAVSIAVVGVLLVAPGGVALSASESAIIFVMMQVAYVLTGLTWRFVDPRAGSDAA